MSFGIQWAPGATTVGVVCKDGIVLGAEKKVHFGGRILSKTGKKVFKISDSVGIACAGLVSDFQVVQGLLKAYNNLFTLDHDRKISVKSLVKLMSGIMYSRRIFPYFTDTLVAGFDHEGAHLFSIDLVGAIIDDVYAAIGTGSQVAIGVLEEDYKEDMTIDEGKQLVLKAIRSAIERDPLSGNGIDLIMISAKGVSEESFDN
ncbi:MAG: proteasome subunit beta [Candidatus Helarchaeota archaeon]